MDILRIALVQLEVAFGQPEENVRRARRLLSTIEPHHTDLALLPELWTSGYDLENARRHSFPIIRDVENPVARLAREFKVFLCGSTLESENGKIFNAQTMYSPTGDLLGRYRKIHLFGRLDEPKFLAAGDQPLTLDLPWGKTGLAVCYDLRFPELFRVYSLAGARLILICAEWPHPRLEHWRTLMRARAIENQAFVVACNAVGTAKGNTFCGHSLVIDPWGDIIAESGEEETVLKAEINLKQVDEIRSDYPVLTDRRTGLYSLP